MKVAITGGAGFLGQLLIRALCDRGRLTDSAGIEREITQITSVDQAQAKPTVVDDRVGYVAGDVSNASFLNHVLAADTDSVFHLAAVVSGAAEADFDLGMRVNLDGTRNLLQTSRTQVALAKVVYASSLAVFGRDSEPSEGQGDGASDAGADIVLNDQTAPTPQTSYGAQKLIGEILLADMSRKGFIDGRTLRLPTVVVRPGKPNAAASGFASGIIREPLAGVESLCPVTLDTEMWVNSPQATVAALIHAHELPREKIGAQAINLPGLTVTVAQMLAALQAVGGDAARARVKLVADEKIRAIVRTWPARFVTARADALGFPRATSFVDIVRTYAAEHVART